MEDDAVRAGSSILSDGAGEVAATEDAREISPDDVCVLIPTLDEATTIADVIEGFYEQGYTNVVIVDGNSTDGTREIAREHGAEVLVQSGDGKGQAVREALEYVTVPYVLMADGDGTYDPADADKMVEPLSRGYEHVIGNRFAEMDDDAMRALNGFGNRMINRAFGFVHGANYEDILSGYRAFTVESFERLSLDSDGFTIETELAVECVKHGVETTVVPVSYRARPDESETNLHPVKDGGTILLTLYSLARPTTPVLLRQSRGRRYPFGQSHCGLRPLGVGPIHPEPRGHGPRLGGCHPTGRPAPHVRRPLGHARDPPPRAAAATRADRSRVERRVTAGVVNCRKRAAVYPKRSDNQHLSAGQPECGGARCTVMSEKRITVRSRAGRHECSE